MQQGFYSHQTLNFFAAALVSQKRLRNADGAKKKKKIDDLSILINRSATDSQNADPEDDEIGNAAVPKTYEHNFFRRNIIRFEKFIQYHTLEIFWIALYTGICAGIFLYYFCQWLNKMNK